MSDKLTDEQLEELLRTSLRAKAGQAEIRGDGLQLIRAATRTRRRSWSWHPILAAAAALVVVTGVGFGVRALSDGRGDESGGAASVADGGAQVATDVGAGEELSQQEATSPSAAADEDSAYAGTPMPVAEDIPVVWPYADTQAAASDVADEDPSSPTGSAPSSPKTIDPSTTAVQFVSAFIGTADGTPQATSSAPSEQTVPGSKGTIVQVRDPQGGVISDVYVRPVLEASTQQYTYVVVGATVPGGETAALTIDPPSTQDGTIEVGGAFTDNIAADAKTLEVQAVSAGAAADIVTVDPADVVAADRWSVQLTPNGAVNGVVVVVRDAGGTCIGLVATTISP